MKALPFDGSGRCFATILIELRKLDMQGLRGSIPPNFPYFFVEFGLSAGSLHVIDDEDKFEKDFGQSILSGLLGLGADRQHRGAKAEPDAVQRQVQSDFAKQFEPYDWTKQLE